MENNILCQLNIDTTEDKWIIGDDEMRGGLNYETHFDKLTRITELMSKSGCSCLKLLVIMLDRHDREGIIDREELSNK